MTELSARADILIVDDTPVTLQLLASILTRQGYKVRPASNGRMALTAAQARPPDLILLDIMMPDMDGYAVCQQLKADEKTRHIPVVFISAISEVLDKVKAFQVGAVDYITKPFQVEEVLARVETHLALQQMQQALEVKNQQLQQANEAAKKANTVLIALNAIVSAANNSLDLQANLEKVIEIILKETHLGYGWLFLSENNGEWFRLAAALGLPEEFRQREALSPTSRCACGEVLGGNQPCSYTAEACLRLAPYRSRNPALAIPHLSLPISGKQTPVGVLNLGGAGVEDFTPDQYEWLKVVTQQIGNAIENSLLYQSVLDKAERLSTLNRVSTIISSSWQLDRVLPPLLSEIARVLGIELGVIVLRSEESSERYKVRARFGRWQQSASLNTTPWHTLPLLKTLKQTRLPLLISNATQDERLNLLAALIEREGIKTVLVLPLIVQDELTGFIQLYVIDRERNFEPAEVELARTLANQAAVAIEKARLYEATITRYEEELEIAHQIQQNLLPRLVPELPGLRLAGLCQPARATSGDFYDYILLPNQQLGIVVGDVTGKSLPAALVMALARNTIRSELVNNPHLAEAMTTANHWLCMDIRRGTFVATVQALLAPLEQKMWLVNAGQVATLLVRDGEVQYLLPDEAIGLPLGIQPQQIYTQVSFPLQSGDTFLFYTDGIVEAKRVTGEMFGFERLLASLQRLHQVRSPAEIIQQLLAEMHAFVGEAEQHDDITLVVVQVEA